MNARVLAVLGATAALGLVGYGGVQGARAFDIALGALAASGLQSGADPSSVTLRGFASLARWLPARGRVGYWCYATGQRGVLDPESNVALGARCIEAQLALAPRRLVLSRAERFLISDFAGATPRPDPAEGLVLRGEAAPGLAVFERIAAPQSAPTTR